MKKILAVVVISILFFSGCRCIIYCAVGPQSIDKIKIEMEGQKADPNIPEGLIKAGVISL